MQLHLIDGIWKEGEALELMHEKAEGMSDFGQNKDNMRRIKAELHKDVAHNCFNLQMIPNSVMFGRFPAFPKL